MQTKVLENTLKFNGEVIKDKTELMGAVNIWLDDEAGEEFFEFDGKIVSTFGELVKIIEENYEYGEELTDRITQPKHAYTNYALVRQAKSKEKSIEEAYKQALEPGETLQDMFDATQGIYTSGDYEDDLADDGVGMADPSSSTSEGVTMNPYTPTFWGGNPVYMKVPQKVMEGLKGTPRGIDSYATERELDMVNHPPHYKQGAIETIEYMELIFGTRALYIYCMVNSFKYNSRAPYKNKNQEDIEKSQWYIDKADELKSKLDTPEEVFAPINI